MTSGGKKKKGKRKENPISSIHSSRKKGKSRLSPRVRRTREGTGESSGDLRLLSMAGSEIKGEKGLLLSKITQKKERGGTVRNS